ncbi:MAG: hypothetical protein ACXWH7_07260 [Thermoanaerobaculia bacterium]
MSAVALAHCNTTDRTRRAYLRANAATLGKPARPAIVIAGFGVTRLVDPVTKRHVWGTPRAVWRTRYDDDLDLDLKKHLAEILFAPGDGTAVAEGDAMVFCSGHQGLAADPSVHRAMIRALRE